ncbi:MAG TPA: Txe/YoeB family addiction module toxin [Pricia antarctica]|uniref:Putative mRNA interferase YoeB n=1 Tax=Pricia antarctica TaxID=641691 RepID=A0A831QRY1_9FLAO|nr:Txe/YoeB family addiction module toxin [Pricia antarctica]
MEVTYTKKALKDLSYWKKKGDRSVQKRITKLITGIEDDPFAGIGKPEALKYDLSGFWSRRINKEHRIVYKVYEEKKGIEIHSLKGHY